MAEKSIKSGSISPSALLQRNKLEVNRYRAAHYALSSGIFASSLQCLSKHWKCRLSENNVCGFADQHDTRLTKRCSRTSAVNMRSSSSKGTQSATSSSRRQTQPAGFVHFFFLPLKVQHLSHSRRHCMQTGSRPFHSCEV